MSPLSVYVVTLVPAFLSGGTGMSLTQRTHFQPFLPVLLEYQPPPSIVQPVASVAFLSNANAFGAS